MDPREPFAVDPKNRFDLRRTQPWNDPENVSENERLLGGLCYVSQILIPVLLPVILLLTDEAKRSRFARYHAVHSLALLAVAVVYDLLALFVFLLAMLIWGGFVCVAWVLFLPPLVAFIYYGWRAFTGHAPVVPWVSEILQRNNLL